MTLDEKGNYRGLISAREKQPLAKGLGYWSPISFMGKQGPGISILPTSESWYLMLWTLVMFVQIIS